LFKGIMSEAGRGKGHMSPRGKVTLTEIAAHAKVSRSTVSLVLRESPLVNDKTRERVRQSIYALDYVYDRGAARMRGKSSQTVGLVVTDLTNSFYAEFIAGVDEALDACGRIALLANTGEDVDRQRRVLERFREHAVDGVILCAAEGASPAFVDRLREWGMPCVQALREVGHAATDFVGTDNRLGTEMATEHLVRRGHRSIVFIGGAATTSVSQLRRQGYADAMQSNGLSPVIFRCRSTKQEAALAAREAFAGDDAPTAAVCFNDPVAMGVTLGVRQLRRTPGEEVAVIGFDDTADAALWVPGLSSIAIHPAEIGAAAAKLLMRRILDPDGAPERIIVPPRLVVRDSTRHVFEAAGTP
jgi:LacI family transcriptional regulator